MALKVISCIFVISLIFGIATPNQLKDLPFDVDGVIEKANRNRRYNLSPEPEP